MKQPFMLFNVVITGADLIESYSTKVLKCFIAKDECSLLAELPHKHTKEFCEYRLTLFSDTIVKNKPEDKALGILANLVVDGAGAVHKIIVTDCMLEACYNDLSESSFSGNTLH